MKSVLIAIRVPEAVKKKAKAKAKELGYIKPSEEANLSEYIRNLIINDRR
jgi:ribosome maturation protein Sdo1